MDDKRKEEKKMRCNKCDWYKKATPFAKTGVCMFGNEGNEYPLYPDGIPKAGTTPMCGQFVKKGSREKKAG